MLMLASLAASKVCASAIVPEAHQWQWNYYFVHDMPQDLIKEGSVLKGVLVLPDKQTVKACKFKFPETGWIDLYKVVSPRPKVLERTIITADFYAEKGGSLKLGLGVDWEATVYCNGKIVFNTAGIGNGEAITDYNNHLTEFQVRKGHNQLIWEVYGGSRTLILAAKVKNYLKDAQVRYQPWTIYPDARDNGITIVFSTMEPAPVGVDYRIKGSEKWQRAYHNLGGIIRQDVAEHSIRLRDLEPAREYEYRVVLLDDAKNWQAFPQKEIYTFTTAPAADDSGKFSFTVTSDLQVDVPQRGEFLDALLAMPGSKESKFFAFIGDVSWTTNFDKMIIEEFVNLFRKASGNRLPLVMVRGNHEIYGGDCLRYFKFFKSPESEEKSYFMFRYGEVCFIVLDFLDNGPFQKAPSKRVRYDFGPHFAAQKRWLTKAVESPEFQTAKYRIVLSHGIPLGDIMKAMYMPNNVRDTIDPLFGSANPKYKIHLWLGGHIHRAFRSLPLQNSFRSVVGFSRKNQHPAIGENYAFPVMVMGGPLPRIPGEFTLTGIQVSVDSNFITVKHFDRTGKLFDHIKIAPDGKVTEVYTDEERFKKYNY